MLIGQVCVKQTRQWQCSEAKETGAFPRVLEFSSFLGMMTGPPVLIFGCAIISLTPIARL